MLALADGLPVAGAGQCADLQAVGGAGAGEEAIRGVDSIAGGEQGDEGAAWKVESAVDGVG